MFLSNKDEKGFQYHPHKCGQRTLGYTTFVFQPKVYQDLGATIQTQNLRDQLFCSCKQSRSNQNLKYFNQRHEKGHNFLVRVFIKNIAISEIVTRVHLYALLDVSIFRYFHLFKKRIKKVASHYMASNKAQAFSHLFMSLSGTLAWSQHPAS